MEEMAAKRKPESAGVAKHRDGGAITFLSDYGLADEFVGLVHSVIQRSHPGLNIIDLSHSVGRHNIRAGALCLERSLPWIAPGAVLAVVDPGVGTPRAAVAAVAEDRPDLAFIGPDNGLLWPALRRCGGEIAAVSLAGKRGHHLGPTFDGRDVFAPAAAAWCAGASLGDLGTAHRAPLFQLRPPVLERLGDRIRAEVNWIDGFGNVQLSAAGSDVDWFGSGTVEDSGGQTLPLVAVGAFGDLDRDALGLMIDSYGQAALVCNGTSAASRLDCSVGDCVTIASDPKSPLIETSHT